jgi:hypothetical protein
MTVITTNLIPELGAAGVFTLTAPFNNALMANASYTCIAIRQLEDIIAAGGDPYTQYYQPREQTSGDLQAQYQADLGNGVCIITLQQSSGAVAYVPSSFVASYPSKGGVPYTNLMMAVDLGAMPTYVDLTFLKQQIANLVKTTVGLTSVLIQTVVVSPTTNLSASDHARAEAARQANITITNTPESQVIALTKQLQTLQGQYANLEAFVNANIDKLTGTTPPTDPVDQLDAALSPAGITLSNNNLTATSTVVGWQSARGTVGHQAGKFYAEATLNTLAGAVGFGVCNASQLNNQRIGTDTNGMMIFTEADGATAGIFYNGGNAQTIGTAPQQGDVVGIAIDLNAKLGWFYNPQTQQWNGDVLANQNPATGLGGLPLAAIAVPGGTAGLVYLGVSLDAKTDAVTINAGATNFVHTAPTGFNKWNTAV